MKTNGRVHPRSATVELGRLLRGGKGTEDAALGRVDQGCPVSSDEIIECVPRATRCSRHGEFPVR